MAKNTFEDLLITRIENGTRAIRLGNKKPSEVNILPDLDRLKGVNEGMYFELLNKFMNVVKDHNKRGVCS